MIFFFFFFFFFFFENHNIFGRVCGGAVGFLGKGEYLIFRPSRACAQFFFFFFFFSRPLFSDVAIYSIQMFCKRHQMP